MRWVPSLRARLAFLTAAVAVLVVAVPATLLLASGGDTVDVVDVESDHVIEQSILAHHNLTTAAAASVGLLAAHSDVAEGGTSGCAAALAAAASVNDLLANATVLQTDSGAVVCAHGRGSAPGEPVSEHPTVAGALAGNVTVGPFMSAGGSGYALPVAAPAPSDDGNVTRILLVHVPASAVGDVLVARAEVASAVLILVTGDGDIVVHAQPNGLVNETDEALVAALRNATGAFVHDVGGAPHHFERALIPMVLGEARIVAGLPFPGSDDAPVLAWFIGGAAAALAVVATAAAVSMLRGLSAPVQQLRATARSATRERPAPRVDVGGMPSEYAPAAQALNEMLDHVEGLRDELEAEIARRTTDLGRAVDELTRSNDALATFAYAASHHLRQPLRTVISYMDLVEIRAGNALPADARADLVTARDAARRLSQRITNLLEYGRVERARRAPVDVPLVRLARRVRDRLGHVIEETGGTLVLEDLPTVRGDPEQLETVLLNLVENGFKFHRPGVPPRIVVRGHREDDAAVIEVEDNGKGIPERYREKVFEMFRRLDPEHPGGGHGVGLTMVRRIVEAHGGGVDLESTEDEGTLVRVCLPANPPPPVAGHG